MATLTLKDGELVNLDARNVVTRVAVSVEVNSKAQYLWKASVYDAESSADALALLDSIVSGLRERFGNPTMIAGG